MKEHERQLYKRFLWWIPCIELILGESDGSSSKEAMPDHNNSLPYSNIETNVPPREDKRFR